VNDGHPELRPGEVFLTNAREWEWDFISYATKRRGLVAFATDGSRVPDSEGAFPVFVSKDEYDRRGGRLL
jgi:hypothetical protein